MFGNVLAVNLFKKPNVDDVSFLFYSDFFIFYFIFHNNKNRQEKLFCIFLLLF